MQTSRMRRVARWLAIIVVMYVVTEALMFTLISIKFGRVFSFTEFEARRREVDVGRGDPFGLGDVPTRYRIRKEVIHPYLGFVRDPVTEHTSPYGVSDVSPVQHKAAARVIVGVVGGSFAKDIATTAAMDTLLEPLKP